MKDPAVRYPGTSFGAPKLTLRLLGTFGVLDGEYERPVVKVGSRKARTALALLAVRRDQLVGVDEIVEVLWPNRLPRHAVGNVATLISRLRSALGGDIVVGDRGKYKLGSRVGVDLYDAVALLRVAEGELAQMRPSRAMLASREVMDLLGDGTVLADCADAPWIAPARALPVGLARRARLVTAEAALLTGEALVAKAAAERAVFDDPLDEPAYRALMIAHAALGEPVRALVAYDRLRTVLANDLGIDPAPVTREIHVAILRNKVPMLKGAFVTGLTDHVAC